MEKCFSNFFVSLLLFKFLSSALITESWKNSRCSRDDMYTYPWGNYNCNGWKKVSLQECIQLCRKNILPPKEIYPENFDLNNPQIYFD